MKTKKCIGMITVICCLTLLSCTPTMDVESEKKAVVDFQNSFGKMFQEKNVEQLVNRFTKDGSLKVPGSPMAMGHEALTGNYTFVTGLENFQLSLKMVSIHMAASGDIAYTLNDYEVGFDTPDGPFSESGKSLIVYQKINGEWKIAAENLSNNPLPVQ